MRLADLFPVTDNSEIAAILLADKERASLIADLPDPLTAEEEDGAAGLWAQWYLELEGD
jgi:hypothetical protein